MWTFPEVLATARLTLRLPRPDADARALLAWGADPEATRWLLWKTYDPADVPTARAFLEACLANWREHCAHRPWMLTLTGAGDDVPIGMLGMTPHADTAVELGYVSGRAHWGQGLMSEAVRAAVAMLFERRETWRVFASTHIDNTRSQRVLVNAGMTHEGTLRRMYRYANVGPEPQDSAMFARVRDDLPR